MHLKVDEELISLVIGEISALDGEAIALQGRLDTLKSAADEKVDQKATEAKTKLPDEKEDDPNYSKAAEETAIDQAATGVKAIIQADYNTASGAITNMQTLLGKLSGGLTKVLNAVTTFNEGVTIEDALAKVQDEFETAGISIEIEMNANGGDTPVLYYTIDGKKYTLSELLNAFYTYTGMHMNTQIQADILMEQLGITDEDQKAKMRLGVTEQVNALTSFAADHRLYGLATEDDILGFYEATTGAELDTNENVASLLDEDLKNNELEGLLAAATGADKSDAAKVAAGAMGAFGLVSFLNTYKGKDLKEKGVFDDAAERVNTATEGTNNLEVKDPAIKLTSSESLISPPEENHATEISIIHDEENGTGVVYNGDTFRANYDENGNPHWTKIGENGEEIPVENPDDIEELNGVLGSLDEMGKARNGVVDKNEETGDVTSYEYIDNRWADRENIVKATTKNEDGEKVKESTSTYDDETGKLKIRKNIEYENNQEKSKTTEWYDKNGNKEREKIVEYEDGEPVKETIITYDPETGEETGRTEKPVDESTEQGSGGNNPFPSFDPPSNNGPNDKEKEFPWSTPGTTPFQPRKEEENEKEFPWSINPGGKLLQQEEENSDEGENFPFKKIY